jgi:hypothetical protein
MIIFMTMPFFIFMIATEQNSGYCLETEICDFWQDTQNFHTAEHLFSTGNQIHKNVYTVKTVFK